MLQGKIFLFPSLLAPVDVEDVLPPRNIDLIRRVKFFVVEDLRTARRFLKACDKSIDIDSLHFDVLNEHTAPAEIAAMLQPALAGEDLGIISDAGCPAVADPGADLVALAQQRGLEVIPLVGPSSILLALMGSGFNGQSFSFLGYLPVDKEKRRTAIKNMERQVRTTATTQIFIETPYRNNRLIGELTAVLPGDMRLCVAAGLTGPQQSVRTLPVSAWKNLEYDYDKQPAIFLIYN